jgi:hypothetical protein
LVLSVIAALLLGVRAQADEATESSRFDPEQVRVEIRLTYSASALELLDFDRSLAVVRTLYGRTEIDQGLVIRAESAISSVRAVFWVDDYEGSSFGRWNFPKWSKDSPPTIEYWDSVAEWSARRLTELAKQKAEQGVGGQPATTPRVGD